jgi:hypothetical protein
MEKALTCCSTNSSEDFSEYRSGMWFVCRGTPQTSLNEYYTLPAPNAQLEVIL